jgi:hypothetical protein
VTKALIAGVLTLTSLTAPTIVEVNDRPALVLFMGGHSLPDLLAEPGLRKLTAAGGIALTNGRTGVRAALSSIGGGPEEEPSEATSPSSEPSSLYRGDVDGPEEAAQRVSEVLGLLDEPALVVVVSESPSAATAADGDELGTVIAAWGDPAELLISEDEPHALTSDSTRRAGVVADVDPAATVARWLGVPYEAGAPIERTGEPAPLDLYERYLQQRRLAVPAATAAWGLMTLFGLAGVLALVFRRRVSPRAFVVVEALAGSLPWLALGLLLVGHLPSLTVATVVPFLFAAIVVGVAFTRWVAARRGIFVALTACGAAILVVLGIEAALGWPAAVTPLAGGGQLDGGRFFGMPNIEIGIVLGSAMFVAHRTHVVTGVMLLATCALVAGSPWTGSNFGAAITLFAAAGLWLAISLGRPWWMVAVVTGVVTAIGTGAIAMMHRYLTDRPTHVTVFLEETEGILGAIERQLERLGVGLDLIADNPLALIPVVGTLVLLVVVLRPPPAIARSFEGHDAWRDAVLVIGLGSIVAYLAEDTGAAAVGFAFGFALSGLIQVSLASARGMMTR